MINIENIIFRGGQERPFDELLDRLSDDGVLYVVELDQLGRNLFWVFDTFKPQLAGALPGRYARYIVPIDVDLHELGKAT